MKIYKSLELEEEIGRGINREWGYETKIYNGLSQHYLIQEGGTVRAFRIEGEGIAKFLGHGYLIHTFDGLIIEFPFNEEGDFAYLAVNNHEPLYYESRNNGGFAA